MEQNDQLCPVCCTNDMTNRLELYQINLNSAVYMCKYPGCDYPKGFSWIYVDRNVFDNESSDSDYDFDNEIKEMGYSKVINPQNVIESNSNLDATADINIGYMFNDINSKNDIKNIETCDIIKDKNNTENMNTNALNIKYNILQSDDTQLKNIIINIENTSLLESSKSSLENTSLLESNLVSLKNTALLESNKVSLENTSLLESNKVPLENTSLLESNQVPLENTSLLESNQVPLKITSLLEPKHVPLENTSLLESNQVPLENTSLLESNQVRNKDTSVETDESKHLLKDVKRNKSAKKLFKVMRVNNLPIDKLTQITPSLEIKAMMQRGQTVSTTKYIKLDAQTTKITKTDTKTVCKHDQTAQTTINASTSIGDYEQTAQTKPNHKISDPTISGINKDNIEAGETAQIKNQAPKENNSIESVLQNSETAQIITKTKTQPLDRGKQVNNGAATKKESKPKQLGIRQSQRIKTIALNAQKPVVKNIVTQPVKKTKKVKNEVQWEDEISFEVPEIKLDVSRIFNSTFNIKCKNDSKRNTLPKSLMSLMENKYDLPKIKGRKNTSNKKNIFEGFTFRTEIIKPATVAKITESLPVLTLLETENSAKIIVDAKIPRILDETSKENNSESTVQNDMQLEENVLDDFFSNIDNIQPIPVPEAAVTVTDIDDWLQNL